MDELNKLKNAWSIDDYDSELGQYTPTFGTSEADIPTVKPLYAGSEEFGEIAPKNKGLHSFDIENSFHLQTVHLQFIKPHRLRGR
mgnify:CR=1 FL=1